MTPSRPALRRKLASFGLGLLLTFAFLEAALALGYRGFLWSQQRQNEAALKGAEGEIRILAMGESTTAVAGDETGKLLVPRTSYPAQLEAILNARRPELRFKVLNAGMMGGTSSSAIDHVAPLLTRYRPHIVIAMMGIKDTPNERLAGTSEMPSWLGSLRTVQLGVWLAEAVDLRRNELAIDVRSADDIPESMRSPERALGKYVKETRLLHLEGEPARAAADSLEVGIYLWYIGRHDRAEKWLRETILKHRVGYNVLARVLATAAKQHEAKALLEEAIREHPDEGMYRVTLAELLTEEGSFEEAQEVLNDAVAAGETFREAAFVHNYVLLAQAALQRERKELEAALDTLSALERVDDSPGRRQFFPPVRMLIHASLGETYIALRRWPEAETHLEEALRNYPAHHAQMWLLSNVYRQTGQFDKEERIRRELLKNTDRLAEYYELGQLLARQGQDDRVKEVFEEAVRKIPSLKNSYRRLYEMTGQRGIQLMVMQYPAFEMDVLGLYAPPAPGVRFIDNERVFDAAPDRYFFEPRFPFSFSHYTREGARVLAEHVADEVLTALGDSPSPLPGPGSTAAAATGR